MTNEFILRIIIAGLLGGVIGFERECRLKEAGLRTHFLVALGSALFMIISQYGFEEVQAFRFDVSRVAAQVVTGIGFIGAGIIIFQKNSVRGLTTAAGLWVTAAIGLGCGGGMFILSAVATLLVIAVLEVTHFLLPQFGERSVTVTFAAPSKAVILEVIKSFRSRKIHVASYSIMRMEDGGLVLPEGDLEKLPEEALSPSTKSVKPEPNLYKVIVDVKIRQENYVATLSKLFEEIPGVTFLGIE
ncbi:MAG: MgtC/SapB family protein [Candidatus Cryptobacteroides sp.]|jgi:putative Mg2+ transporter-C (MgtC) family protein